MTEGQRGNDGVSDAHRPSAYDDLLTPSIAPATSTGPAPWRVSSQFWVYFFGGILAGGVIAYLNCIRLGVGDRERWIVVGSTAVGLVATLVAAAAIPTDESTSSVRLASRVIAVVLGYLVVARVQRTAERASQLRNVEPSSLWGPGFAALFTAGVVQAVLVAVVSSTL